MGRYDGEDYEDRAPCAPDKHQFMPNGSCHACRRSRSQLIANAEAILRILAPEKLAKEILEIPL